MLLCAKAITWTKAAVDAAAEDARQIGGDYVVENTVENSCEKCHLMTLVKLNSVACCMRQIIHVFTIHNSQLARLFFGVSSLSHFNSLSLHFAIDVS